MNNNVFFGLIWAIFQYLGMEKGGLPYIVVIRQNFPFIQGFS